MTKNTETPANVVEAPDPDAVLFAAYGPALYVARGIDAVIGKIRELRDQPGRLDFQKQILENAIASARDISEKGGPDMVRKLEVLLASAIALPYSEQAAL